MKTQAGGAAGGLGVPQQGQGLHGASLESLPPGLAVVNFVTISPYTKGR